MALNAGAAAFVPSERSPTTPANVHAPPFQPRNDVGPGPAGFSPPPPMGGRPGPGGFNSHQPSHGSPMGQNSPHYRQGGNFQGGGHFPHQHHGGMHQGPPHGGHNMPPQHMHHHHHHHHHHHNMYPHGPGPQHMGGPGPRGPMPDRPMGGRMQTPPPPMPDRRRVVLLMGSPCSGKKTIASRLEQNHPGFVHINGPVVDDAAVNYKFAFLDEKLNEARDVKGFVLTNFTADSEADVYYLFNILKRHHLEVDFVIYLDLSHSFIPPRQGNQPCTSLQMLNYATEYECASEHFSEDEATFSYVQCKAENGSARSVDEIYEEITGHLQAVLSPKPLMPVSWPCPKVKPKIHDKWELVEDPMYFHTLLSSVDEVLHSKLASSVFPLRSPGNTLDYPRFVRNFHHLKHYHVTLSMSSQRVLIFGGKVGTFLLLENCTAVYRLQAMPNEDGFALDPDPNGPNIQYVVEAELVSVIDQNTASHLLIRDVLFRNECVCGKLWKQRKSVMHDLFTDRHSYVLFHQMQSVTNIQGLIRIRDQVGDICTGLRFEHNGTYKLGASDSRIFTWQSTAKPQFVTRLWHSKETTGKGRQVVYHFRLMVVDDDTGCETELVFPKGLGLPRDQVPTLTVGEQQVSEMQLNDGMLVEVDFELKSERVRAKEIPSAHFTVCRRRPDLPFPCYKTTASDLMLMKPWPEEFMLKACEQVPDQKKAASASK